jgi:hypothetical protein
MALQEIFYIEEFKKDGDTYVANLSTANHPYCIEIYGSKETLTKRVIKVLQGLNTPDPKT